MANEGQILSVDQLRLILDDGRQHEFFVALRPGVRSSKSIYQIDPETVDVFHHISDSWEEMTYEELEEDEIMGEAIRKGAFFYEGPLA